MVIDHYWGADNVLYSNSMQRLQGLAHGANSVCKYRYGIRFAHVGFKLRQTQQVGLSARAHAGWLLQCCVFEVQAAGHGTVTVYTVSPRRARAGRRWGGADLGRWQGVGRCRAGQQCRAPSQTGSAGCPSSPAGKAGIGGC